MVILGFLFLVGLALYFTLGFVGTVVLMLAFGNDYTSDRATTYFMFVVAASLWIIAYFNAPFHIVFN